MEFYEAVSSRRTVRDFQKKEIEANIVQRIIEAGLQAPTNDHMRQWEFVIVNDKPTRLRIIGKLNQNRTESDAVAAVDSWGFRDDCQREMYIDAIPKQHKMLLNAGCLIIPCFRQKTPLLQPVNLSALNGFASIWCCIENILLAAAAEGIYGVTRIPSISGESELIKETLKLPEGYEIPCYVALGYPTENAKQIEQHRPKAEDRIHVDKW